MGGIVHPASFYGPAASLDDRSADAGCTAAYTGRALPSGASVRHKVFAGRNLWHARCRIPIRPESCPFARLPCACFEGALDGGFMSNTRRTSCIAPLVILLLAGCGDRNSVTAPTSGDSGAQQSAAAEELARHPELVDDGLYETQTQAQTDASSGTAAAIDPLFFWREILRIQRSYEFAFADTDSTGRPTTILVTVHKRLGGWFNVLAKGGAPEGSPTEGHVVRKPLRDHWVRRVLLKRVHPDGSELRPWRVAAVSGVNVTSRDAQTRLLSLRIQSGDLDTTLADPLVFWRLRRVLRLEPEAPVTLTATTEAHDDVVVLYARDRRSRFHNNGDGTYTATWSAAALSGLHHLGVNALSHDTLYDDEAPYDSQTWILPYVVAPTELAELAP